VEAWRIGNNCAPRQLFSVEDQEVVEKTAAVYKLRDWVSR